MYKKIAILTSGGDAPGLNAVIRAVVKTAIGVYGMEVLGIEDGYEGLLDARVRELSLESVRGLLPSGGTFWGTPIAAVSLNESPTVRQLSPKLYIAKPWKTWRPLEC